MSETHPTFDAMVEAFYKVGGLKPGEQVIFASNPSWSHGKSWFAHELANRLARVGQASDQLRGRAYDTLIFDERHDIWPESMDLGQAPNKPLDTSLATRLKTSKARKAQVRIPSLLTNLVAKL